MRVKNDAVVEKKVKSILISQPKPDTEKSPYFDLARKYKLNIEFKPFIRVEGIPGRDFRKARIVPTDFSSVILTSRNSIDHFFRICEEFRVKMSQETKFFCISEAIALYLQKYTQYRKRRVFFGNGGVKDLMRIIQKHKDDGKILFPCSDVHKEEIPEYLKKNNFDFKEAVLYKTLTSDLSDLEKINFDMIVFFSPIEVKSLFQNFPKYKQGHTLIAGFGPTTCQAIVDAGLALNLKAPIPEAPSMTMAIDKFLQDR